MIQQDRNLSTVEPTRHHRLMSNIAKMEILEAQLYHNLENLKRKINGFACLHKTGIQIEVSIVNPLIGTIIPLPDYHTNGSAAIDLRACTDADSLTIKPGETKLIGSGIAINIPQPNIAAILLPRSGLGANHGIVLGNLIGLIDSDYHQEIKIAVWNRSSTFYTISQGDRICQMAFVPIIRAHLNWVSTIENTERGGFGSTGIT